MQFQSLQCSVCLHEYDLESHLPRILPHCGHSVCGQCLVVLLASNNPKCPLDNQQFPYHQRKLEMFPVNFSLRGLIEEKTEVELCPMHEQKIEFFCHTDRCTLCAYCALYEGHREHVIKPLKNVKTEITTKRKELESALDNLNGYYKELNSLFDEKKTELLSALEDNFEHFISYAKKKKIELALEINSFFGKEKDRLNHYCGKKSAVVNTIRSKIMDVKEGLPEAETEQDKMLQEFGVFDPRILKKNFQEVSQKLKEASNLFSSALAMQTNVLDHLEFSSKDVAEKLKSLYPQNIPEIKPNEPAPPQQNEQKAEIPSEFSEIRTSLKVDVGDGYLQVKINPFSSGISRVRVDILNKTTDFRLAVNKQGLEEEEVEDLLTICKELKSLKCVKIITTNQNNQSSQNYLSNVFKTIFANPQNMEEIELNLRYTATTDGIIVPLAQNMLPTMPKLKSLALYLRETHITDRSLEAIAKYALTQLKDIEILRLDLQSTNVTEKGIVQLFVEMPKVKALELGLSSTDFTDKGLEFFVVKTLKSMIRLQILEMSLYKTRVSDKSAKELFINLPNLQKLTLDFHSTLVSDSSLKLLMQEKLPQLTALRFFTLELSRTRVSDKLKADIWKITGSLSG